MWFDNIYMELNKDAMQCNFIVSSNITEHLWAKVGDELIWERCEEKLLGVIIVKNFNFNSHLTTLCKKVGQKVTALARIVKLLPFYKRRLILKTFIESQFSHCPLVRMFCSRKMNMKINYIPERALSLVYNDYRSSFEEILRKDKSISIHHRNIHNVAIEMFKVKHKLSPPLMTEIFEQNSNGRTTRMGDIFTRTTDKKVYMGENSLSSLGIRCDVEYDVMWNTMRCGIRCDVEYDAMWNTMRCGIRCDVEYDAMWNTMRCGIRCDVEYDAMWNTMRCGIRCDVEYDAM